ncbi:MAG: threonine synthase [Chloroflexi bacterium]|nr:threonine synthase [Chloroflexota bacterium]
MSRYQLRCRGCQQTYPAQDLHTCAACLGPLEVVYAPMGAAELRIAIERGPRSLWRYAPLLPVDGELPDEAIGLTPLVHARRLGAELGLARLYLKNDTVNPSFSFKDRVVAVAAQKAKEFGYDTIACASTGNLAGAVAAAAARHGLRAVVFVPSTVEPAKLVAPLAYGATLVEVDGTYDEVNRLVAQVAEDRRWAFVNFTLRPYYVEGSKTLLFEAAEQLGWRLPDAVVIPIASGAMYVNTGKAARELVEFGIVAPQRLRIFGAQPAGCAPVAEAFASGAERYAPVRTPRTIAHSLAIGAPADGNAALALARATEASIVASDDDAIRDAILRVARSEGIFVEPAGGVTVAALVQLARSGALARDAVVVVYLTGNGFKTPDAVDTSGARRVRVAPRLDAFDAALPERDLVEVA